MGLFLPRCRTLDLPSLNFIAEGDELIELTPGDDFACVGFKQKQYTNGKSLCLGAVVQLGWAVPV